MKGCLLCAVAVVTLAWVWVLSFFFFFQAEDGIRDIGVTGVQTCALPIYHRTRLARSLGHHPPLAGRLGEAAGAHGGGGLRTRRIFPNHAQTPGRIRRLPDPRLDGDLDRHGRWRPWVVAGTRGHGAQSHLRLPAETPQRSEELRGRARRRL